MITKGWGFKVYGEPKPKGSMKCIGARGKVKHQLVEQVDDNGWRNAVTWAAAQFVGEQADKHQAVYVEMMFTLSRPAAHYGTGANRHLVKASAPVWPTLFGTGDTDKLARLVLDALQDAKVLDNDAQVRPLYIDKAYYDAHPIQQGVQRPDVLTRAGALIRVRPRG